VSAGVPIIDLDVAPPQTDAGARSLRRRISVRRSILIVAALVLAFAAQGAATVPAPRLIRVLSAGGTAASAFTLGADALYTAQFGNNPNSESAVRRFALADVLLVVSSGRKRSDGTCRR
jgi:hypothetical protein